MKKIYILLCAALAALAIVSCNKDAKEEAFVEPETQVSTLSSTAVSLIKEADPNYWGEFVKTAQGLFKDLRTIDTGNLGFGGVKGEIEGDDDVPNEYYTLQEDIDKWFEAVEEKDNVKFFIRTIRLSLLTGDITVEEVKPLVEEVPKSEIADDEPEEEVERVFVYTRSNNPLNLTYKYGEKTYKFQFEAVDAKGEVIKTSEYKGTGYYDEKGDWKPDMAYVELEQVAVPSKVALHVTENGASFIDAVINPDFGDVNWDTFANWSDEIHASANISIPGYSLTASDVKLSLTGIEGKLELFHGNTSLLALDGKIDIDYPGNFWEEPDIFDNGERAIAKNAIISGSLLRELAQIPYTATNKVEGTLKVMGGQVVLKGYAYPHSLVKFFYSASPVYDENDARNADAMLQQYLRLDLSYNNGSKPQGRIVYVPIEQKVEQEEPVLEPKEVNPWQWTWGIRFADYSFKSFQELEASEDFDAVIGQAAIFMAHGNAIFDEEEEVEEGEPLEPLTD